MGFNADTKMGVMLDDVAARAVLVKSPSSKNSSQVWWPKRQTDGPWMPTCSL